MEIGGCHIAQFTASSTARRTLVMFGFVPDFAVVLAKHSATNPDILFWANKGGQTLPADQQVNVLSNNSDTVTTAPSQISQWLDADDHLKLAGSTTGDPSANITRVTTGIKAYFGGEVLTADETVDSNPVHVFTNGGFPKSGFRTLAGLEFPAAVLTNSALYIVVAFRQIPDQRVANLVV